MCGEVVAAPLSLQDTVYPILRKKSLHFCEKSKKSLKLCTAVRKKYKMKRLRRKTELPQAKPDGFASSLGEGAFGMAVQFAAQAQSLRACPLPLGGAAERSETGGVTKKENPPQFSRNYEGFSWRSRRDLNPRAVV